MVVRLSSLKGIGSSSSVLKMPKVSPVLTLTSCGAQFWICRVHWFRWSKLTSIESPDIKGCLVLRCLQCNGVVFYGLERSGFYQSGGERRYCEVFLWQIMLWMVLTEMWLPWSWGLSVARIFVKSLCPKCFRLIRRLFAPGVYTSSFYNNVCLKIFQIPVLCFAKCCLESVNVHTSNRRPCINYPIKVFSH